MEYKERLELARQLCQMCDTGTIDVYSFGPLLSKLVESPRVASCSCHSVAGRFCREAQGVLQELERQQPKQ